MKKITFLLVVVAAVLAFSACSHSETYADQLERENEAIHAFIVKKGINVISEDQFAKQGNTTDVTKNQYVHFSSTGVYMQIVERGTGNPIRKGETATVLCRFTERNLIRDTLQLSNQFLRQDVGYEHERYLYGFLRPVLQCDVRCLQEHVCAQRLAGPDDLYRVGQTGFGYIEAGARAAHCSLAAGTDQCLAGCLSLFLRPYVPEGTLMERRKVKK